MVSVVPLVDFDFHNLDTTCACDPSIEWINEDTGLPYANGPLVIHNSCAASTLWGVYES